MRKNQFVAYLRVSREKQGATGLGIDAQRADVERHVTAHAGRVVREFVEVESGKKSDRPKLIEALAYAKATGSTLVIAKLDRLARNVAFVANLMESGVDFVCCDNPHATRLTIHILAAVAEDERERIVSRTKAALGAIKRKIEQGQVHVSRAGRTVTRLGNPMGSATFSGAGNRQAVAALKTAARARAIEVLPIIEAIKADGARTLQQIADEMNARGILTARQGRWHPASISNILERASA